MTMATDATLSVKDLMVHQIYTVHQEAPMMHAAKIMGEHSIRHLVVVDSFGKSIGLFSERDMLRHIAACAAKGNIVPGRIAVKAVMKHSPVTVTPDETIPHVAALLASRKIGCVPVVDKHGDLVGIVSVIDVLRAVAGETTDAQLETVTA